MDPATMTWDDAMDALETVQGALETCSTSTTLLLHKAEAEAAMLAFNSLGDTHYGPLALATYARLGVRAAELDAAAVMLRCAAKLERIERAAPRTINQQPLSPTVLAQARALHAAARDLLPASKEKP